MFFKTFLLIWPYLRCCVLKVTDYYNNICMHIFIYAYIFSVCVYYKSFVRAMQVFYFVSSHNIQPSSLSGGIVEGSWKELKLFAIALGH